jgi:hypothetical protein
MTRRADAERKWQTDVAVIRAVPAHTGAACGLLSAWRPRSGLVILYAMIALLFYFLPSAPV